MQTLHQLRKQNQVLDGLLEDLSRIRIDEFSRSARSREGIVAGQLRLLLTQIKQGITPHPQSLYNFISFISRNRETQSFPERRAA